MSDALTFSIVIPVYNRAKLVRRAIASCLLQRHPAFEVVVVDDGSTDGTAETVSEIVGPRLRLFVQPVNRGVSAARNLGVERARGEWIVFLDSDDELTSDALSVMDGEIRRASDDVQLFRFMCQRDDGSLSPAPPLRCEVWDCEAYLRWAAEVSHGRAQDTLMCVRRRTFDAVRLPDGHALEPLYHMDFAARFRTATRPAVLLLCHSDAPNQLTRPNVARALAGAADHARSFEALLDRHGAALARWAPSLLVQYTRGLATQQFLAGDRLGGFRTIRRLIRARGGSLSAWAVLGLGLLGRRILAHAQQIRKEAPPNPNNHLRSGS
jgi:hypothetical protein